MIGNKVHNILFTREAHIIILVHLFSDWAIPVQLHGYYPFQGCHDGAIDNRALNLDLRAKLSGI
eukprot:146299-Amorphochlora_amoeboformis.AAC.1